MGVALGHALQMVRWPVCPHLLVQVVMLRLLLVHVVVLVPVHVGVGVAVVRLVGVARRVRGLVAKHQTSNMETKVCKYKYICM